MSRTKNKKNKNQTPLEILAQETLKETPAKKIILNPPGEISISDAISQIIAPYRDTAQNYDSFKKLVTMACAAWNVSILPAQEADRQLKDLLAALSPDPGARKDFLEIINLFIVRKKKLFPHVTRMVVKFKVTDRGDDFHIAITSTLAKEPSE